jgi:hypothetical protein
LFSEDVEEIYSYLSDKKDYRYIVDGAFFGPLTAAFEWKIDPNYFQKNIEWENTDKYGFINVSKLGNIYSKQDPLSEFLCLKHHDPTQKVSAIVVDKPGKYDQSADLITHDFTRSLKLHAVYDVDKVYVYVKQYYPGDLCKL